MSTPTFESFPLPFVTDAGRAIGGRIKREPRQFAVEEIPLYEPCGIGEHVYVRCRREGRTTPEMVGALARVFGIGARDVGCAGLKDKQAIATQTFSLPLARLDAGEVARRVQEELGVDVLWARRHANKLRRGHLLGNRFDVLIEDVRGGAAAALAIGREIEQLGLPNFYGPQRFGADGRNAQRGRALLDAPRKDSRSRFMISALQSLLFNAWLAERMRLGRFALVRTGDIGKRTDDGALFEIEDEDAENARMRAREITYTGPIYGSRMRTAACAAGELEEDVLRRFDLDAQRFSRANATGSRRAARLFVRDLEIFDEGSGVRARFSLPKGAYATVLLRELMKTEAPAALDAPENAFDDED